MINEILRSYRMRADEETIARVAKMWERRAVSFIRGTIQRLRDNNRAMQTMQDFKIAARAASRLESNIPGNNVAKVSELILKDNVRVHVNSLIRRLRNWESVTDSGAKPPTGILLYGPPGTGKTHLVKAMARELGDWHVFEVNTTTILHDPRKFTEIVERAATHRPAFVFIDEADELLRDRNYSNAAGATNEILKTMDGTMGRVPEVVFVAATNNAEVIDGAALRGGRFSEKIYMGRLSGDELVAFMEHYFSKNPNIYLGEDLTPESFANEVGEVSVSDATHLISMAINFTFGECEEGE
jgi:transitional endoplasmic reticulum ATPase